MADSSHSPGKLFRCGICSCDFPTLNACIAHMKHHAAETLMASSTQLEAPPAAGTLQLQTTSIASPERKNVSSMLHPSGLASMQLGMAKSPENISGSSHCKPRTLLRTQDPTGSAGHVAAAPALSNTSVVGSLGLRGPGQSQALNTTCLPQTPVGTGQNLAGLPLSSLTAQHNCAAVSRNGTAVQQGGTTVQQNCTAPQQKHTTLTTLQNVPAAQLKATVAFPNSAPDLNRPIHPVTAMTSLGGGAVESTMSSVASAVVSAQGRLTNNVSLLVQPPPVVKHVGGTNVANMPKPPTITVNRKNYKLVPFPASVPPTAASKNSASKDSSVTTMTTAKVTQASVTNKTSLLTSASVSTASTGFEPQPTRTVSTSQPSDKVSKTEAVAAVQSSANPQTLNTAESTTTSSVSGAEPDGGVVAAPVTTAVASGRKALLVHSDIFETVPVMQAEEAVKPKVDTKPSRGQENADVSSESEKAEEGQGGDQSQVKGIKQEGGQTVSINEDGERRTITLPEVKLKRWASLASEKPYECPEPGCGARYRFLSSLSIHRKRHSGERPFQCKICQKRFWHPTNLRVHQRTHSGVRRYECGECGHGFNQLHDLRIHMTIHTGELPLKCPVKDCSRAFRDPSCYRRHMNRHAGVQPHLSCDKCEARFYHHSALNRHYRRHTGEKDYVCDVCGAAFARADTLKLHQRGHSGQKPYSCSVCHMQFADRSYCRRHVGKHSPHDKAVILANLSPTPSIKQETPAHLNGYEESLPTGETKAAGKDRQKRESTIVPVQIPNPPGSDVPYTSIEIEIPESDLQDGEGGDVMYQYGDMLISISRAAVNIEKEVAEVDSVADLLQGEIPMEAAPAPFYETEHKYSRAVDTVDLQCKKGAQDGSSGLTQDSSGPVVLHPQPLSEFNEIVSSILDPEKGTAVAVGALYKKQKNPRVGERRWSCKDCNASYFHQAELKRHRTKHTGEMPYQCHICFKRIRDPSNLKRHVRTHTGDRPYRCDVCKKKFSQAGHLSAHTRIHTGERPYKCDQCPSRFVEANHLRYHKKMHAGIKEFKCSECELRFIRNAELKRHMKVHSGIRPFQCDLCPSSYFRQDGLKLHRVLKHQEKQVKPFPCPKCNLAFSKQIYLDRHLARIRHTIDSLVSEGQAEQESTAGTEKSVEPGRDKPDSSLADVKNSVAADALCELATGVRSAVISVKGGSIVSSLDGSDPNPPKGQDCPLPTKVKVLARALTAKRDDAKKAERSLPMEDEELSSEGNADEMFVKTVMVEGGTLMGTEARKVHSHQAMEVQDVTSSDTESVVTYHTLGEEGFGSPTMGKMIVVDTSTGETFQVDTLTDKKQTRSDEEGEGKERGNSSYIQVGAPLEASNGSGSQVTRSQQKQQQSARPVSIIRVNNGVISTTSLCTESTPSTPFLAKTQSNPTTPVSSPVRQTVRLAVSSPESSQAKPAVTGRQPVTPLVSRRVSSRGARVSMPPTDSSLVSTMQLIVTGKAELQKVDCVARVSKARRRGRPPGSKTIKEEPESDSDTGRHHPLVGGPLRTRSGRERKIKVKYSA